MSGAICILDRGDPEVPRFAMSRRHLFRLAGAGVVLGRTAEAERADAPDFQLYDARGVRRGLSDFRGKVVLLNFWATWCPPCRREIPVLNRMHRAYAGRGFTVLGVAMDERGWAAVTPFLAQWEVEYPILLGNSRVAKDYGGLKALPRSLFLDRTGRVVASKDGMMGEKPLRKVIATMLAESPATRLLEVR